ncbi:MAG: S8 family peptidase [Dysgonamonadaceae bacterium]|jgi:subtilisin family serine protease|nr:S8 family peptidase [Dysgonamonadaceae bacterium]
MNNRYKHGFLFLLIFALLLPAYAQEPDPSGFMFRLLLKDKGNPPFTLDNPSEYLSQKAIDRRTKQGINIDSTDLPIDPVYLSRIKEQNATIKAVSKWVNTVVVYVSDSNDVNSLKALPFVDSAVFVWKGTLINSVLKGDPLSSVKYEYEKTSNVSYYGDAYYQIHLHKGELLHEEGFRGEGMTIGVIDGTFLNATQIEGFNRDQIRDVKNFTHQHEYNSLDASASHGTKVLSCMLSEKPGSMVGTAPKADYYLIQTEVNGEEFLVEEDFWIAGIEYADSVGVDVVNSSLGYTHFDLPEMNHTHAQLDGNSVLISKAASMAADKGMLVFIAAGNEGNKTWIKISFPADADNIVAVGAVRQSTDNPVSTFSSMGFTADGRIKPDLMAVGTNAAIVGESGNVGDGSGTSFASPILAGLGACLWQALPDLTNKQIIAALKKNANRFLMPDSIYGYGIPDVYQAYRENKTPIDAIENNPRILQVDVNSDLLFINLPLEDCRNCCLMIFSALGTKIFERTSITESIDIRFLSKGIYIAYLNVGNKRYVRKFIKY